MSTQSRINQQIRAAQNAGHKAPRAWYRYAAEGFTGGFELMEARALEMWPGGVEWCPNTTGYDRPTDMWVGRARPLPFHDGTRWTPDDLALEMDA